MLELNPSIIWTFVNLIVLTLLLKKFLFGPVQKVMDERANIIKTELEEAKVKNTEAQKQLEEANAKIQSAQDEAQKEYNLLVSAGKAKKEAMIAEAAAETSRMLKESKIEAERERTKILLDTREEMVELAFGAAKKVIGGHVSDEMEHKLFADIIEEVGASDEQ